MEKKEIDKTSSIIKLGLWLVFILILVFVAKFSNKNTTPIEKDNSNINEVITITYEDKINAINDNYSYKYYLKVDNKLYEYDGYKMVSKEKISKTYYEGVKDYYIENDIANEIVNNEYIPVDITVIYEGINKNNIDISIIKELLLNNEYTNEDNKYIYNIDGKSITVEVNDNNIERILINENDNVYDLNYSNINGVTEENFK